MAKRHVTVQGSIAIMDHETIGSNEFSTQQVFGTALIDARNVPSELLQLHATCGGEVRVEVALNVSVTEDDTALITGTAKLFEGTSHETGDLEQTVPIKAQAAGGVPRHLKIEMVNAGGGDTATIDLTFANEGVGKVAQPLTSAGGLIYSIKPKVEATMTIGGGHRPASGGELIWARHLGRGDGTFRWEGPKVVGTGWADFTHVFAGEDGVVYAIKPKVEATEGSPASGGELIWARHVGRDDGTFRWDGPKVVGTGWADFTHVFAAEDGVIYAIKPKVEASIDIHGKHTPASGGELIWARHVGRDDGTFTWEGPEVVGTGWADFKEVFAGGDGVVYAIKPIVEASIDIHGKHTPASGGELIWARHVGRHDGTFKWDGPEVVGTGWADFKEVFADDDGVVYAIKPKVEASMKLEGGHIPASGGELIWARHTGRHDGTFKWDGPRVVGAGWAGFKQVF